MRLVTWNVKVGRTPIVAAHAVRRVKRHARADRLALLEAGGYVGALRLVMPRWRVQHPHGSDVVLLTRKRDPAPTLEVIAHDYAWTGPHTGKPHAGRGHLFVDGWQLFVHRVSGGPRGPNRVAYAKESALIRKTLSGLKRALCLGDQNAKAGELARWWRAQGMRPIRTGRKVDHGGERGCDVEDWSLDRKYGSDHYPIVADVDES
jgi:hypothetical protein